VTPVLVAADLDHTLVHPAARAREDGPAVVVEVIDGRATCAVTRRAWHLLTELAARHTLVPVTTRTPEQYARVRLPGPLPLAVCANGAVLLERGLPDAAWARWSAAVCAASAPVGEVAARLGILDSSTAPWVRTWRVASGAFVYVVAHRREDVPADWLAELEPWLVARGWCLSVQGRKVYAVPAGLSKAAAVERLRERFADGGIPPPLLAAGDAVLDATLLEDAGRSAGAVRPAHGELHERGWDCFGLTVTTARGAAAGEELLGWLLARADELLPAGSPVGGR